MGLISQTIPTLKGGVSQQPEHLRYPEQCSEQINGWSSELGGVLKRPPMVSIKQVYGKGTLGSKPLVHLIDRDEDTKYFLCFTGTGAKAIDITGKTVDVQGDMSYVLTDNPARDLKVLTIADYTFIVNTKKIVKQDATKNLPSFNTKKSALIVCRGGQYGRTFNIKIKGETLATTTLPDGSKPEHVKQLDAQVIAGALKKKLDSSAAGRYTTTLGNAYILIEAIGSFNIENLVTEDGYANQLLQAVTHNVQSFNKLPLEAPNDYIIKISGDMNKGSDAYYVKYNANDKLWEECVGWNVSKGFKADTMPHAIVREDSNTYRLQRLDWGQRTCGDEKTNPDPTFVGETINDIFLYRNRIGLLTGENVVLSKTGKYFDFMPSSVASLSDDDPIDVAVSSARINILKYAVPYDNELVLFSDNSQFALTSATTLTANNLQLNLVSSYKTTNDVRPLDVGKGMYFVNRRSGYSSVYRYYNSQTTVNSKIADDVTAHVPTYIPDDINLIKGSTTENFLALMSNKETSTIYFYKFFYDEETLKQQSWSKWKFNDECKILSLDAIGSILYVLIETSTRIHLCSFDFTRNTKDFKEELYQYHLDFKVRCHLDSQPLYDENTGITSVKLTDVYGADSSIPFAKGTVNIINDKGVIFRFEEPEGGWTSNSVLKVEDNLINKDIFVGVQYDFEYKFSKYLIKQIDQNGSLASPEEGRLQLKRAWVSYQHSGHFEAIVNDKYKYPMSGLYLNYNNSLLGKLAVSNGSLKFACQGNAENTDVTIKSSTPTPLHLISSGWEGLYLRRTTSV